MPLFNLIGCLEPKNSCAMDASLQFDWSSWSQEQLYNGQSHDGSKSSEWSAKFSWEWSQQCTSLPFQHGTLQAGDETTSMKIDVITILDTHQIYLSFINRNQCMFNSASQTEYSQLHSLSYTIHVVHVTMIANEVSYFVWDVDNEIQRPPTKTVKSPWHSWSCSWGSHLCVVVWTPDPSGHARKGLEKNLAWKCLAGMPQVLNPANFIRRSSTRLVRYYSNFQNFYVLPYIHFLSLVELEHWLAEMHSFPHQQQQQHSSAQDTSGQGYSPDPSSHGQECLGSRLPIPYSRIVKLVPLCWFTVAL